MSNPDRMTARQFHESGLLYHINETALWPLGLALAISRDADTGEYAEGLTIIDRGEVIQDPSPDIRATANATLAERFRTVKP